MFHRRIFGFAKECEENYFKHKWDLILPPITLDDSNSEISKTKISTWIKNVRTEIEKLREDTIEMHSKLEKSQMDMIMKLNEMGRTLNKWNADNGKVLMTVLI